MQCMWYYKLSYSSMARSPTENLWGLYSLDALFVTQPTQLKHWKDKKNKSKNWREYGRWRADVDKPVICVARHQDRWWRCHTLCTCQRHCYIWSVNHKQTTVKTTTTKDNGGYKLTTSMGIGVKKPTYSFLLSQLMDVPGYCQEQHQCTKILYQFLRTNGLVNPSK